jgi:hypothetical protein
MKEVVGRTGFEPVKAEPVDLQSTPFDRFGTYPIGEERPTRNGVRGPVFFDRKILCGLLHVDSVQENR